MMTRERVMAEHPSLGHRFKRYGAEEVACEGCGVEPWHRMAVLSCPSTWSKVTDEDEADRDSR